MLCTMHFTIIYAWQAEIARNYFTNGQILTTLDIFVILARNNNLNKYSKLCAI